MKQLFLTVRSNEMLVPGVWRMILAGDCRGAALPGQFINIRLDGFYLRRPISVCDADDESITIIYKVVGRGTDHMTEIECGSTLDVLAGLGAGFTAGSAGAAPLLVGGGAGLPPMYLLAKKLTAEGLRPSVIMGFNTESEVFYEEEFRALGCEVTVTTADGSRGVKGFVTDALPESCSFFYACGPLPMLKALSGALDAPGELSFEERMGCGFGACMGCSMMTKSGPKRVCKDGPVFRKEEIIWEQK